MAVDLPRIIDILSTLAGLAIRVTELLFCIYFDGFKRILSRKVPLLEYLPSSESETGDI